MLNLPAAAEEAVTFGVIPCQLGGQERLLRTRKIGSAREWKSKMARHLGTTVAEFDVPGRGGGDSIVSMIALADVGSETILDLVLEYDEHDNLGGRDWVEANADETEVYLIFRAILDRHFPFVRDVLGMIRELARLMAETPLIEIPEPEAPEVPAPPAVEPSPPASSPNGLSPTGTSTRRPSRSGSTKRS